MSGFLILARGGLVMLLKKLILLLALVEIVVDNTYVKLYISIMFYLILSLQKCNVLTSNVYFGYEYALLYSIGCDND